MADQDRVRKRLEKLRKDAADGGYILNADDDVVQALTEGLVENEDRYGIETCPCRLFDGGKEDNMDIVCPCVYREDDLAEYGACYCSLYVASVQDSEAQIQVPERRLPLEARNKTQVGNVGTTKLAYPVYRCTVCGYLSANNNPPGICPVCKAKKDRFERFM